MPTRPRLLSVLASLFVFAVIATAQTSPRTNTCSDATLNGRGGVVITGTDASGLMALSGQLTADGRGGITGSETISENGVINVADVTGSYSVNPDCTGNASITPEGGPTSNFSFTIVFAPAGLELVVTDPGTVEVGSMETEGKISCGPNSVDGPYGLQASGMLAGLGPLSLNGRIKPQSVPGCGKCFEGIASGSINGQTFTDSKVSVGLLMGGTCTGQAQVHVNQLDLHVNVVLVEGGRKVLFIDADSGSVLTGFLQR